jgi:hypothetical protein
LDGYSPEENNMKSLKSCSFAALLVCCLCFACSPTVLTGSWRDPEYTGGPLKKVLVVSLSRNDLIRRMLEDEFARQLGETGIQAVSSYGFFTGEQLKEQREQVEAKIRGLGFDQVLVTRLVGKRTEEVVQPGTVYGGDYYPGGWNGYYRDSWNVVYQPPVTYQVDIATIESKLFDLDTGKMIWSGLLETEIGGTAMSANKEKVIRSFVRVVVKDLKKEKLI